MINKFKIKFGSSPVQNCLEINSAPITLFVGPNNSGKSVALKEIYRFCQIGHREPNNIILEDIEFDVLKNPDEEISELISWEDSNTGRIHFGNSYKSSSRFDGTRESLLYILCNPNQFKTAFTSNYLSSLITWLSGFNRLEIIRSQERGDLKEKIPRNILTSLFIDDKKRT